MHCQASASNSDSIKVESLLTQASRLPADSCKVLFFARSLLGVPYVANTLDETGEETLTVCLDRLDCTTFVETVLALALADRRGESSFGNFRQALQHIRYRNGELDGYPSRLHYFSDWIKDNEQKGIVRERTGELPHAIPQVLHLDFMSTHPGSYPQLKGHPAQVARIQEIEARWKNVRVPYLPKASLHAPPGELGIRNGDIIAITTSIAGLDVVHTGFACLADGEWHLLHASSAKKKVILDPQSLYDYSKDKKAHTGVRVISFVRQKP